MQRAYLQMHFAIFLWGFTGILGKLISLQEYPLVWWRILLTVTALGLFLKWKGELEPPPWKEMKKIAFVGSMIALHWVTFYGSIKYSNVSIALSTLASSALFTAILDPLLNKKKPKVTELGLGLFTVLGIYLIFQFQQLYTVGITLGLISAALSAYFTIQTKGLLENHGPRNLLFYELIGGFATLTLFAPLYLYLFPSPTLVPTIADSGYLLLLALVCTVYAMQLSYKALKHVSPFVMNLSVNLEPIYSIVLAAFIFREHEELNTGFYVGAGIIISSVAVNGLIHMNSKRRARKETLLPH